jgi:hypothetical protein
MCTGRWDWERALAAKMQRSTVAERAAALPGSSPTTVVRAEREKSGGGGAAPGFSSFQVQV